jgi:hypothetical protein
MSEQSPQPPATAPRKAWYMKWWVWLVAAAIVVGGVNAVINPSGDENPSGASQPTQDVPAVPTASEIPAQAAPLDLNAFLTSSGVAFDSARISARKAWIYVPTETTDEEAQQIAHDAMHFICDDAKQAGDKFPAANRVEVSDSVSINSPNYNAADHPSGFATEEICEG